jgi:hypothetical protein
MASSESNYLPFISGQQRQQIFSCNSGDDPYTALILEETEKVYNELMSKLTNDVISVEVASVSIRTPSLPSDMINQRFITMTNSSNQIIPNFL